MSERVAKISEYQNWMALDALAAAYATGGRYADAVGVGRKAVEVAKAAGSQNTAAVAGRLALYEKGEPYRESLQTISK